MVLRELHPVHWLCFAMMNPMNWSGLAGSNQTKRVRPRHSPDVEFQRSKHEMDSDSGITWRRWNTKKRVVDLGSPGQPPGSSKKEQPTTKSIAWSGFARSNSKLNSRKKTKECQWVFDLVTQQTNAISSVETQLSVWNASFNTFWSSRWPKYALRGPCGGWKQLELVWWLWQSRMQLRVTLSIFYII